MGGENLGQCRYCRRRIRYLKMQSGKTMPVDETLVSYKSVPGGKDRIVTLDGNVVACEVNVGTKELDGYGYISHFATCNKKG